MDPTTELGFIGMKICSVKITMYFESKATQINPYTNRQHDSFNLPCEKERSKKSGTEFNSQKNMELLDSKRNHIT